MRRVLSFVLTIALLLSLFLPSANAEEVKGSITPLSKSTEVTPEVNFPPDDSSDVDNSIETSAEPSEGITEVVEKPEPEKPATVEKPVVEDEKVSKEKEPSKPEEPVKSEEPNKVKEPVKPSDNDKKDTPKTATPKDTKKEEEKVGKNKEGKDSDKSVPEGVAKDLTKSVNKNGVHVSIKYSGSIDEMAYIPEFTLSLRTKSGKVISTTQAGKQNYSKQNSEYNLILNHTKGFKLGEEYQLLLKSTDNTVKTLTMTLSYLDSEDVEVFQETTLKANQYFKFKIREIEYEGEKEGQIIKDVSPSSIYPLEGYLTTDNTKTGFLLKSKSGAVMKNTALSITLTSGKGKLKLKSNNQGMVWVNTQKLTNKVLLHSDGYLIAGGENGDLEFDTSSLYVAGSQEGILTYSLVLTPAPKVIGHQATKSNINVSVKIDGNSDLSKNWTDIDLTLDGKGGKQNFTLNHKGLNIGSLSDGSYSVKASGKYAKVNVSKSTLTVKKGRGSLALTIIPKYTLDVGKDGKPYKFTVVNASEKVYSGSGKHTFAVSPGESYMIKDNASGEIYTVAIDTDSLKTKVVLGVGVVFGGSVSTPHTGDIILFLVGMFIASLIGAVVMYIIINRKNPKDRNRVVTLLTLFALTGSLFSPFSSDKVSAAGGSASGSNNASAAVSAGTIQTDDDYSVLQAGFVKMPDLDDDSGKKDMEDPYRYSRDAYKNMLYLPSNSTNKKKFENAKAMLYYDSDEKKAKTLYGKNPLIKNSKNLGNVSEIKKRLISISTKHLSSGRYFEAFLNQTMTKLSADKESTRQFWAGEKSSSAYNYGTRLNHMYDDWVDQDAVKTVMKAKVGGVQYTTEEWVNVKADLVFDSYIDTLKKVSEASKARANAMQADYHSGNQANYVLVVQMVQSFHVSEKESLGYAFMPFHDAANWYLRYREKSKAQIKNKNIPESHEAKILYIPGDRGTDKYQKQAPTWTYLNNTRGTTGKALKPSSKKVKINYGNTNTTKEIKKNPFQGWGFFPWKNNRGGSSYNFPEEKDMVWTPKLNVKLKVKYKDSNNQSKSFTKDVAGWTDRDLSRVKDNTEIAHPKIMEHEGSVYDLSGAKDFTFTLVDEKDKGDSLNKDPLLKSSTKSNLPSKIQTSSDDDISLILGYDTVSTSYMDTYLGGRSNNAISGKLDAKYPLVNKDKTKTVASDALLTITIEADKIDPEPVEAKHSVPQWRLSKYYNDISNGEHASSLFTLSLPNRQGYNGYISPSGNINFNLIDPDLSKVPWAYSNAKLFNDTPVKFLDVNTLIARFVLAGDLLAVRTNNTVDNIKLASWVNNFSLFDGKIEASSKGAMGKNSKIVKSHDFKYKEDSANKSFTFHETRTSSSVNEKGETVTSSYHWSGPVSKSVQESEYKTTVSYGRYLPTSTSVGDIEDDEDSENGLYWEAKQGTGVLKVDPEILQSYDDKNGNMSMAFTAGDRLRKIQPVHYNLARYVNVNIKQPEVSGMSVATDPKAKQLAASQGAGKEEVIYKGSSVTTNFEVAGNLELKTFAVDIGATSLKNAWNPSTTYSTDAVNNEFLGRYAKRGADGKWEVELDTEGKIKIGNDEHGGKEQVRKATQTAVNVKEHTLEVRGGKLIGVDGSRNLSKLSQDMKDALKRMSISTDDNIFSAFENVKNSKASSLTEEKFATLGNTLRGTNELAVGKPWYSEDTTVLVVREYTNTFKLPQHQFTDKIPMKLDGLETPMDKNQFFNKGLKGHGVLEFSVGDAQMIFDSSEPKPFGGKQSTDFVVPNVSVMDTMQ